jgi:hypothetical protein
VATHPIPFTTVRGQSVEVYGQGLYRYDALQKAAIFRGGDAVTLFRPGTCFLFHRSGTLQSGISERAPRLAISLFLLLAGMVLALVWLSDILTGLIRGEVPPSIQSYTTEVTYVIDLGVMAPVALLGALLVQRRSPVGYLLAAILLTLNAIIGVVVVAQTVAMQLAGLTLGPGQLTIYVGSFVLLSAVATWLAVRLFQGIG